MIPYTVRKKVEEAADEVGKKHNIKLSSKQASDLLEDYFRMLKGLMAKGEHNVDTSFVKRIEVPTFGFLRYNPNIIKKKEESKNRKPIDNGAGIDAARALKKKGWHFLKWTQENGYIFYNQNTDKAYGLKREGLFGNYDAYMYFLQICDTDFVRTGYSVYLGENISPAEIRHGAIVVYDRKGRLVKRFNTLEEVMKYTYFSLSYVQRVLLYNWENEDRPKRMRNTYWFYDKGFGNTKQFYSTNVNVRNKTLIDMIDVKTGKVQEKFGTASDIVEYLDSLSKYGKTRTSTILRLLNTGKAMYGFKYRRSILQINKQEKE
jgi:YD repeat-containing protein